VEGIPQLRKGWNRIRLSPLLLLPVASGILSWASFPKVSQGYLAWVALTPLLFHLVRTQKTRNAFLGGLIAGMIQFLGTIYWIPRVMSHYGGLPVTAAWGLFVLLLAMLGCFPAVACAVTRYCIHRGGTAFLLVFAPVSISLEYIRCVIPFGGFPWLLTGYSQTDFLRLIQIADLLGVYGVGFLVVWVNVALVWAWIYQRRRILSAAPIALAGAALAVCLIYGSAALRKWDTLEPSHHAALLQENLSVDEQEPALTWKYQQGYVRMADQLSHARVDLLILPESPSPLFFQLDQGYREALQSLARRYSLGLIFNNVSFRETEGAQRYFNSAFFLDQNGVEVGRYDKIHLVPFGEYVPLRRLFFFSQTISRDVGGFHPGDRYLTVPLRGHAVSAVICFEAIFPELSSEFIRRGSQLIINLTNDSWYGNSSAPYQHLAMARWRAVESRRYLLRAANSGISAIVAPSGRIQVQTGLLCQDIAVGRFAFLSSESFYVRLGGYFPILCVIIVFLALLWSFIRGLKGLEIQIP
jgi:apolipoprotein N-acyltransferase